MIERDQARDTERLPEETVRRLLARASELEVSRVSEMSVTELREAAREAGIAPGAFEPALAEVRARHPVVTEGTAPTWLRRLVRFWPLALTLAVLLSFVVLRLIMPAR